MFSSQISFKHSIFLFLEPNHSILFAFQSKLCHELSLETRGLRLARGSTSPRLLRHSWASLVNLCAELLEVHDELMRATPQFILRCELVEVTQFIEAALHYI